MAISLTYLSEIFDEYNAKFFNNQLTKIPIVLKPMRPLGQLRWNKSNPKRNELRMSTKYAFNDRQLRNTFCHEMIHLWQFQTGCLDMQHGRDFKRKASEIMRIDPSMTISVRYNDTYEGELLGSTAEEAYIVVAKKGGKYLCGRMHDDYVKTFGWLKTHETLSDVKFYKAKGEMFSTMVKSRTRLTWCYSGTKEDIDNKIMPCVISEVV